MDENGRVHPECSNAANPYHECGVYCLEKIAEGKGRKEKDKKNLDNRNGLMVVHYKRNEDGAKLQPNCPKASNPYHECNESRTQRTSMANTHGVRKESDNRNGIKQGELSKKKDEVGRVHTSCSKASNPYHECDENCSKRSTEAKIQGVKKESDVSNGITQGVLSKKKDVQRTMYPSCPKASNPYHECDENCCKSNTGANTQGFRKESGSKILDASRSFGRKKKGSESQPKSPRGLQITPSAGAVYPGGPKSPRGLQITPSAGAVYLGGPKSPRSHFSRKKMEVENGESFSSSEQHSEEIYSRDQSFDKALIYNSQSLPMSGKIVSPSDTPTKNREAQKVQNSPKVSTGANTEDGREDATGSNFSFSGIVRALEESDDDEEEVESVISDSCVSVGKYHVKASISSILQSIFDKYGDIAANCQLESASMRAYYLECLCAVVQELHSTPFKELTKAKVKEMFAVLKDVESAQIDVTWLRALLNEISEAVELVGQRQTFEAKKAKHERSLESARKELESQMEDLAEKEKELADARKQAAETKARVDEMEHECSQVEKTISSIVSITEKFQGKSLADKLL